MDHNPRVHFWAQPRHRQAAGTADPPGEEPILHESKILPAQGIEPTTSGCQVARLTAKLVDSSAYYCRYRQAAGSADPPGVKGVAASGPNP